MMWDYLKFPDETQIAYSEMRDDNTVLVGVERPVDMGFDSARCILPSFNWFDVEGFTDQEMEWLDRTIRNNAPFIYELAEEAAANSVVA